MQNVDKVGEFENNSKTRILNALNGTVGSKVNFSNTLMHIEMDL